VFIKTSVIWISSRTTSPLNPLADSTGTLLSHFYNGRNVSVAAAPGEIPGEIIALLHRSSQRRSKSCIWLESQFVQMIINCVNYTAVQRCRRGLLTSVNSDGVNSVADVITIQ